MPSEACHACVQDLMHSIKDLFFIAGQFEQGMTSDHPYDTLSAQELIKLWDTAAEMVATASKELFSRHLLHPQPTRHIAEPHATLRFEEKKEEGHDERRGGISGNSMMIGRGDVSLSKSPTNFGEGFGPLVALV